jgi:ABC-2 type transport system permease protein
MMNDFIVVFSAEVMRRIRSRPFQIGVLVGILGIAAFVKLPPLLAQTFMSTGSSIVLAGDRAIVAAAKPLLAGDYKIVAVVSDSAAPTASDLKKYDVSSWVTFAKNPKGGLQFTLYSHNPKDSAGSDIANDLTSLNIAMATSLPRAKIHTLLSIPYTVTGVSSKFASSGAASAAWGMSYFLLLLLYMLILINSQLVMSSVAEEKTSRIAELLIASMSPAPLLYGKIAAATATGLLQMALWAGGGLLLTAVSGSPHGAAAANTGTPDVSSILLGAVTAPELAAFVILFGLGFLQFSMLFAGIGSLINRTEDLGSISMPIVLPVVAGFILAMAALGTPDASWAVATSFVPLVSPFVLFARIAMSNVPLWQIAVALAINVASAWAIAALAGKLYRVGMLLYGRPPSLKQIGSVIRS